MHARSAAVAGPRIIEVAVVVVIVVSAIAGAVVVCVVDHAHVDVVVRAVIEEVAAIPVAALVAEADVAKAIVDAAVEADVQAPVAGIKEIPAAIEPPIARSPERAFVRRLNPSARHPVIAARAPGPIAGSPDVAVGRRRRLIVVGKRWRRFCCLLRWHLGVA